MTGAIKSNRHTGSKILFMWWKIVGAVTGRSSRVRGDVTGTDNNIDRKTVADGQIQVK